MNSPTFYYKSVTFITPRRHEVIAGSDHNDHNDHITAEQIHLIIKGIADQ